jgi:hypothetical protein
MAAPFANHRESRDLCWHCTRQHKTPHSRDSSGGGVGATGGTIKELCELQALQLSPLAYRRQHLYSPVYAEPTEAAATAMTLSAGSTDVAIVIVAGGRPGAVACTTIGPAALAVLASTTRAERGPAPASALRSDQSSASWGVGAAARETRTMARTRPW